MNVCLRTRKPSRYITNTKVNSTFHLFAIGKSSSLPACLARVKVGRWRVHLCRVADTTVWSHMACDAT